MNIDSGILLLILRVKQNEYWFWYIAKNKVNIDSGILLLILRVKQN